VSLIHRQKRTQKETEQEAQPVTETPMTEYAASLKDATEKRERWNAIEAQEAQQRKELVDNASRAFEQQQIDKAAREKEQADKNAVAEQERLKLKARNDAEAAERAKRERDNYEWSQAHKNMSETERLAMNAQANRELLATVERKRLESQTQHEAQLDKEAQEQEKAHQDLLKREREHRAALDRLAEEDAERAAEQVYANGNLPCEICGGLVRAGAAHHMSPDFKTRCVRDISATLAAGVISPEYADQLRRERSALAAK
jgi:hypothetical protein